MKTILLAATIAISLLLPTSALNAAEASGAKAELGALVGKIQTKLREGKRAEKDLTEELKEFDALLAKHKDEKTDEVAQILYMKATLYLQVFSDNEKGKELLLQLKKDFPETAMGKRAEQQVASIEAQSKLSVGATFPDFKETDLAGKPLSIANYKGKVVLVDFWATWCGPCVGELPNVHKAYDKHHGKGFEIIGISLDSDKAKLESFMASNKMTWVQYFDGKAWENKLAQSYGIRSIPATFLLDGEGKIIAKDLRGEALEAAVAKAFKQ